MPERGRRGKVGDDLRWVPTACSPACHPKSSTRWWESPTIQTCKEPENREGRVGEPVAHLVFLWHKREEMVVLKKPFPTLQGFMVLRLIFFLICKQTFPAKHTTAFFKKNE